MQKYFAFPSCTSQLFDAGTRNQTDRVHTELQEEAITSIPVGQETAQLLESVLEEEKRRGKRTEAGRSLGKMRIP